MYLMISGNPPFYGNTKEKIVAMIKAGFVDFSGIIIPHKLYKNRSNLGQNNGKLQNFNKIYAQSGSKQKDFRK